jgi:hypothetical protein
MLALYGWTGNTDQPIMVRMGLRKIRRMRDVVKMYFVYNMTE